MPAASSNTTDFRTTSRPLRAVPSGDTRAPALPRLADGGERTLVPAAAPARMRAVDALALCLLDGAGGG